MSIVKIQKRLNPYAQIDVSCLNDNRLSWRAKGILCYLLSKPDTWKIRVADIWAKGKEGRNAVQDALNELKEFGYADLRLVQGEGGRLGGYEWTIYETPKHRQTENRGIGTDKPTNRKSGNREHSNKENNSYNNSSSSFSEPPKIEVFEPQKEIQKMESDQALEETFCLVRKIPRARFREYLNAFAVEIKGTGEKHFNAKELKKHFLNWSTIRHRIEEKPQQAAKPTGRPAKANIIDAGDPKKIDYTLQSF